MKKIRILSSLIAIGMLSSVMAQSQPDPIDQLIKSGISGVQNIKKNDDGTIKSLTVVASAPISKALPKATAKDVAKKTALINARAEFVKWLNTSVEYYATASGDTAISIKGSSGGDEAGESITEASNLTKLSDGTQEAAKGFVSGLQNIGAGVNDDSFVVVMGWDAKTTEGIAKVRSTVSSSASLTPVAIEAAAVPSDDTDTPAPIRVNPGKNAPVENQSGASQNAPSFF